MYRQYRADTYNIGKELLEPFGHRVDLVELVEL